MYVRVAWHFVADRYKLHILVCQLRMKFLLGPGLFPLRLLLALCETGPPETAARVHRVASKTDERMAKRDVQRRWLQNDSSRDLYNYSFGAIF
jgi:hypothetical protein